MDSANRRIWRSLAIALVIAGTWWLLRLAAPAQLERFALWAFGPDVPPYEREVMSGKMAELRGDQDVALSYYQKALDSLPQYDLRRLESMDRIEAVRAGRNSIRASHTYTWVCEDVPATKEVRFRAALHYGRGERHFDDGRNQGALKEFEEFVRLEPNCGLAYRQRAKTLDALGKKDAARADWQKALDLELAKTGPRDFYSAYTVAYIHDKLGMYEVTLREYQDIRRDFPGHNMYLAEGNTYMDMGRYADAAQDFTKGIAANPDNEDYFLSRGYSYNRLNQFDNAISDFTNYISKNKDDKGAFAGRGWAYESKGEVALARADYARAAELAPPGDWLKQALARTAAPAKQDSPPPPGH